MWKCVAPCAAICGRWVMQSTWNRSASRCSRPPTTSATAPPIPASTSSKMSVLPGASVDASVFERQHDSRQLPARDDAGQRPELLAGVRRDEELRLIDPQRPTTAPRTRPGRSAPRIGCAPWRDRPATAPAREESAVAAAVRFFESASARVRNDARAAARAASISAVRSVAMRKVVQVLPQRRGLRDDVVERSAHVSS